MNTNSFYRSGFKVHVDPAQPVQSLCVLSYVNVRAIKDLPKIYQEMMRKFRAAPGYLIRYKMELCAAIFKTKEQATRILEKLLKEGYPRYEFHMFYR